MRTREKQMRTIRQLVALIALAMLAIGACAGSAAATPQRFGAQSLPDTVTGSGFVGADNTFVPTAAATASTQPVGSPINGVLTLIESRYSMAAPAAQPFGYRILTNTGGLNFTARPATISGTAQNRTVTPPPSPAVAADAVVFADAAGHPRGINIAAGERLGVFAGPNMIFNFSAGGATVAAVSGDHTTGSQLYAPAFGGLELKVRGTVEPDADGDTYGDDTQDNCPTIANDQTSNPCPPPQQQVVTQTVTTPVVNLLSLTNRTFRVGPRPRRGSPRVRSGTAIRFGLSEGAQVTFTIERRTTGRRVGGRCRTQTRGNRSARRCTRFVRAGSFTKQLKAGPQRVHFSGKLRGRALRPASYRVGVQARDGANNVSRKRTANFRVVR